jgi:F-type H+-transporting ATPase subunit delta
MSSRVVRRYARALLDLAADQNQLEAWGVELERIARLVASPEIGPRLTSPEIPEQARVQAMQLIGERLGLSYPLQSFAVVLARHRRIGEAPAVSLAYQDLLDERLGRARATITFAAQPSDDASAQVVAGLEKMADKKIIATFNVDPALLGGVVAQLEGITYDASLANRLEKMKRRLSD